MNVIETDKTRSIPTFEEYSILWSKNHNRKTIKDIINQLGNIISQYEKKYKMTTPDFLVKYSEGEFEMDDNYLDHELAHWRGSYEAYQRLLETEK
jgi:hypothetical protein